MSFEATMDAEGLRTSALEKGRGVGFRVGFVLQGVIQRTQFVMLQIIIRFQSICAVQSREQVITWRSMGAQ